MKTCLVQGLALLLMVGALYGQSSQSTSHPVGGQHSHDQMQMPGTAQLAQQNAPPSQNQPMPGMQMPPAPEQPKQRQTPAGQQQMPGMQMPQNREPEQPSPKVGPVYTLEQLQQSAIEHNPTVKQAQAEIRAAEGRKRQAGLYPNPTVGYLGEQISGGSQRGGEQGGFIQQDIVLGGKLGAARRVSEQERRQAEAEREEQLLRVQNAVAMAPLDRLVDRDVQPEIVCADDQAPWRARRLPQPGISRWRRNWKNSTPSRSRRRIISGLRIISPSSEAIFFRRK